MTNRMKMRAGRLICLFSCFSLAIALGCTDSDGQFVGSSQKAQVPTVANLTSGISNYASACAACHATDGSGTERGNSLLGCESCKAGFDPLVSRIHATMPEGNPAACQDSESDTCARDTAAHILCALNPDLVEGCSEAISLAVVPPEADRVQGEESYAQCQFCHGVEGQGVEFNGRVFGPPLTDCQVCQGSFEGLESYIHDTMPPSAETNCSGQCALDTAAHVLCAFNPDLVDAESCEILVPKAVIPASADLAAGAASYAALCSQCHFADGSFRLSGPSCLSCQGDFGVLSGRIHISMPPPAPALCSLGNSCAENVAAYVFCEFNPERAEGCP